MLDGKQRSNWTGRVSTSGRAVTKRLNHYFDTSHSYNASFTFGNIPRWMPNLFEPGLNDWSMSLFKDTEFHENLKL